MINFIINRYNPSIFVYENLYLQSLFPNDKSKACQVGIFFIEDCN